MPILQPPELCRTSALRVVVLATIFLLVDSNYRVELLAASPTVSIGGQAQAQTSRPCDATSFERHLSELRARDATVEAEQAIARGDFRLKDYVDVGLAAHNQILGVQCGDRQRHLRVRETLGFRMDAIPICAQSAIEQIQQASRKLVETYNSMLAKSVRGRGGDICDLMSKPR